MKRILCEFYNLQMWYNVTKLKIHGIVNGKYQYQHKPNEICQLYLYHGKIFPDMATKSRSDFDWQKVAISLTPHNADDTP